MKWLSVLIIVLTWVQSTKAQDRLTAERLYVHIPLSQTATSAGIAAYINSHYQTSEKKLQQFIHGSPAI